MWEFSLSMDSEKSCVAKYIYNSLEKYIKSIGGVITSYEQNGKISIIFACNILDKNKLIYEITNAISYCICTFVKEDFLDKNLKIANKNELEKYTFKKSLVNFDRETDRFIINKYMVINNSLYLESFFHFKLQSLKEKWTELVKIANDNSTYFLSDDSFLELLKFLIDNIEFSCDEINVIFQEDKIYLLDKEYQKLCSEDIDQFKLVDKILDLSPRKINWYSNGNKGFLEKVFEKRILFINEDANLKNIVDKCSKMV